MMDNDSRYMDKEHRNLLRTTARLPLTLSLLTHADYMDDLVRDLVEALDRCEQAGCDCDACANARDVLARVPAGTPEAKVNNGTD